MRKRDLYQEGVAPVDRGPARDGGHELGFVNGLQRALQQVLSDRRDAIRWRRHDLRLCDAAKKLLGVASVDALGLSRSLEPCVLTDRARGLARNA